MNIGNSSTIQIDDLEQLLEKTLLPLKPKAEFVSSLRQQLESKLSEISTTSRYNYRQTILLTIAGVAGSCVMIITSVKVVLSLIGVLGLISSFKRKAEKKPFTPSQNLVG
ncbi:MAG: hypothetical protein IBX69_05840 [Anaerolineales bacterium]|nr:hypothetical protein [Anaerolineales bacterium]